MTRTRAKSSVNVRAGSYGDTQLSSVFGQRIGEVDVLGVAELTRRDGYRANSDYDRVNVFLKGSKAISSGVLSARASHYSADWSAPGYIPFAAYQAGAFSPTDSLFETDGGRGRKTSLVITHAPAPGNGLTATAYYENIRRSRFGTFGTAPQNEQDDLRNVFGSKAYYTWEFEGRGDLNVGYEYRHDNGVNGQFQTVRRARNGVVGRDYKFDIDAISFYTDGSVRPWQRLKLLGGLRYDIFRQDIFNRLTPTQSGDGSQTIASPHVGLVFEATDWLELFANYGTGFRSLQVTELSPVSATRPQGFDLTPPQVRARDTGLRLSMGAAMVNVSVYTATVADEIQETAPGSNVFANIGNTKRQGYQVDGRLEVMPGLSLTAAYSHVHARVINPAIAGRDRVDSNPRSTISAAVQHSMSAFGGSVLTDFFLQQVGAKPYYANNVLFETTPYQENNLRWPTSAATPQSRCSASGGRAISPRIRRAARSTRNRTSNTARPIATRSDRSIGRRCRHCPRQASSCCRSPIDRASRSIRCVFAAAGDRGSKGATPTRSWGPDSGQLRCGCRHQPGPASRLMVINGSFV